MSDLRGFLERGVGDFDPFPGKALEATLRRARRRHHGRLVATSVSTVVLTTALVVGLWAMFMPAGEPLPIAGPTASPTPPGEVSFRVWCNLSRWDDIPRCISRTGRIVTIASGSEEGTTWAMQGFRATYTGPAPELPLEAIARTPVARPMICTGWTSEGQVQDFLCNTVYRDEKGGPGLFGMDFGLDLEQDVRPPSWADQVAGGDPLEGVREFGLASSRNTENHHVLLGWTRPTTARIEVMLQRRGPYPVGMYGPFSELGTEVKWFVAFSPIDVPMITITAFDAAGGVIWQEREEQVVPLRVSKVGGGAGTVLGYSTFDLSCGEACPHPPRPRIDCGTTCSTGVLPGFGLTLEALPAVGSRFVRWEGACEGVDPSCSVTVRRGTDVTAVFEPA